MSPDNASQFGTYVKGLREERGMSQGALARELGWQRSTLMRLERGEFSRPDPAKLQQLAGALEIEVEELFVRLPYVKAGLPGLPTYLRAKYGMSEEAIAEAEKVFAEIEAREGGDDGRRAG